MSEYEEEYSLEVSSTDWWLDNGDNTYDVGVYSIELDFCFNNDISGEDFTFDVCDADGNVIGSYLAPQISSYYAYCIWTSDVEIPAGGYYIKLYDGNSDDATLLGSGYCEVK